jgi:hypothetical protein
MTVYTAGVVNAPIDVKVTVVGVTGFAALLLKKLLNDIELGASGNVPD